MEVILTHLLQRNPLCLRKMVIEQDGSYHSDHTEAKEGEWLPYVVGQPEESGRYHKI